MAGHVVLWIGAKYELRLNHQGILPEIKEKQGLLIPNARYIRSH
jgi:hypothetical protein